MVRTKKNTSNSLRWPDGRIPAAIYARVSSQNQDVENSVDAQVKECRAWAERNGYVITRVFIDRARSGRASDRPDFQEMMEAAGDPRCEFQVVLVWRFSRFYRDRLESGFYKRRLSKTGVRVVSINEPVEDTAVGRLTEGMLEAIDGFQSDIIGEDVSRGKRHLAEQGFFCGSTAPYGMMRIEETDGKGRTRYRLAPDPITGPYLRRLFDLALEGKTEGQATKSLNAEGVPGPNDKPWKSKRVHDALTNPHYEGTIVWGKSSKKGDPVITPDSHVGIVTPEEFAMVQGLLRARAPDVKNPRHAGSEHLLSGMVKCRQCGSSYTYATASREGKTYHYLVCDKRKNEGIDGIEGKGGCDSPWLPVEWFEALVMDKTLSDILVQGNTDQILQELRAESGGPVTKVQREMDDNQKRLADIDRRQDRIFLAFENGEVDLDRYGKRNRKLEEAKSKILAEYQKDEASIGQEAIILENPGAVLAYTRELNEFLRSQEKARCKPWLESFIKCIWVEPGHGAVQYRIPLPDGSRFSGQTRRTFELGEKVRRSTRLAPPRRGSTART